MHPQEHAAPQEKVLYPGGAWLYSHPDRLATNAWFFGMSPAPVEECRVLELGCGAGQNLVPMAYVLPQAQFLGVELVTRPVEHGRKIIAELGLTNIELRQLDIASVTRDLGEFDFIIVHGVYSWVPPEVREAILRIFGDNLAPHGVAYMNYKALPGGHIRAIVRDMMLYHLRGFEDPENHIPEAMHVVRALAEMQPDASPYGAILKEELGLLERNPPSVLYHDLLAEEFSGTHLHEVLEQASRHGLQYLCESRLADVHIGRFPATIQNALSQFGAERADREQYLDFLVCQKYRRTLLCRDGQAITPTLRPERMRALRAGSSAHPVSNPLDLGEGVRARFANLEEVTMETDDALVKNTLVLLGERWPRTVPFDELLAGARQRMNRTGSPTSSEEQTFSEFLAATYAAGLVNLHLWEPDFTTTPGEKPRASALARYEVASQSRVTALRHNSIHMDDAVSARVLSLLDGSRDRDSLLETVNTSMPDAALTAAQLEAILSRFGEFCLLEA
jgi:SAM-dependent methyltransferase